MKLLLVVAAATLLGGLAGCTQTAARSGGAVPQAMPLAGCPGVDAEAVRCRDD